MKPIAKVVSLAAFSAARPHWGPKRQRQHYRPLVDWARGRRA